MFLWRLRQFPLLWRFSSLLFLFAIFCEGGGREGKDSFGFCPKPKIRSLVAKRRRFWITNSDPFGTVDGCSSRPTVGTFDFAYGSDRATGLHVQFGGRRPDGWL